MSQFDREAHSPSSHFFSVLGCSFGHLETWSTGCLFRAFASCCLPLPSGSCRVTMWHSFFYFQTGGRISITMLYAFPASTVSERLLCIHFFFIATYYPIAWLYLGLLNHHLLLSIKMFSGVWTSVGSQHLENLGFEPHHHIGRTWWSISVTLALGDKQSE